MYDDLIKRLQEDKPSRRMMLTAADAIEELLDFAHYVASQVVVSDDEWENDIHYAFPEIASRKLNKLGIVEKDGAFWCLEPPKEE